MGTSAPVVGGIDRRWLDAGEPQHIGQRHPRPLGAAHAAVGPLVPRHLRREIGSAVAAVLQHHAIGPGLEALLEIAQRNLEGPVDLTIDGELPGIGLGDRIGDLPIAADVEPGRRRGVVVEQSLRRLGHQRLVAEHDQPAVLAGKVEPLRAPRCRRGGRRIRLGLLRQCRRNQPSGHAGSEDHRPADRSTHGGEASSPKEPAPGHVGPASKHQRIGALGIVAIKLTDRPFLLPIPVSPGERNRDGLPSTQLRRKRVLACAGQSDDGTVSRLGPRRSAASPAGG